MFSFRHTQRNQAMTLDLVSCSCSVPVSLVLYCSSLKKKLSMATWSKDNVLSFIEEYRSHECLWKIKSKDYSNRMKREQAYDKIVDFVKSFEPEADKDLVIRKFNNLRSSYRKQIKKLDGLKVSGAGTADAEPKLWYFNALEFLRDQEIPRPSLSNIETDFAESIKINMDDYLLYIIITVAAVVFITICVVICCCCYKKRVFKHCTDGDVENQAQNEHGQNAYENDFNIVNEQQEIPSTNNAHILNCQLELQQWLAQEEQRRQQQEQEYLHRVLQQQQQESEQRLFQQRQQQQQQRSRQRNRQRRQGNQQRSHSNSQDRSFGRTNFPEKTKDLHFLSVSEAMRIFIDFVEEMEEIYHDNSFSRKDRFIYIITGRGKHSKEGIAKIKPAVQGYLDKHDYDHEWENEGGMVKIDLLSKRRSVI